MELHWSLIIFTLLIAWAGGIFAIQSLLAVKGEAKEIQLSALICSLIVLVVGGIAVFLHLQHWERIFKGFGHLTSGITQEFIAIVVFGVVAVAYFFALRKSEDGMTVPKPLAIVGVIVGAVLVAVTGHSYMMASRPAWNTVLWVLVMLAEGALSGALTVAVLLARKNIVNVLASTVTLVSAAVCAVATLAYTAYWQMASSKFSDIGFHFDPTLPTKQMVNSASEMNVFTGSHAALLWVGVIIVGVLVPLVLAYLARQKKQSSPWLMYGGCALICLLIGGIVLRVLFYELGFSVFMFY